MLNFTLWVSTVDGQKESIPLNSAIENESFSLCGLDFTVRAIRENVLPELEFSFVPQKEVALHRIALHFPYDENAVGGERPIYMFDNDVVTNACPGIRMIPGRKKDFFCRELITYHSGAGELNLGFTTFNRFFAWFRADEQVVRIQYEMEDKPVRPGEKYTLELLTMDDTLPGLEFFERYTQTLHDRYRLPPRKPTPSGWSSWSCMYTSVTEKDVEKQAKELAKYGLPYGADLIQIDDGWQKGGTFGGWWTKNEETFPHDIPALAKKCRELGLRLGLWNVPGLVEDPEKVEELRPLILRNADGEIIPASTTIYGLDISKPEVIELGKEMYRQGVEEYGSVYFKMDFIVNLLLRMKDYSNVVYPGDYAAAQYRRYFSEIRKTVGDDVFMLASGAPIGESIGIFDGIRASADIAYSAKKWWNIIREDAQATIMRSPFHEKVFINDPDALLVRDFPCRGHDDGVNMTLEEARTWATVVAMCGGHILINEEIDRLSEERREIFTNILPPMGKAARPRDFYEFPQATETFIRLDGDSALVALFNWDDEPTVKVFDPSFYGEGRFLLVDCWTHRPIGCADTAEKIEFSLKRRDSRAFLLKRIPEQGGYLYSDGNFNLGYGPMTGHKNVFDYFYCPEGASIDADMAPVENDFLKRLFRRARENG